jgi:penicillin amidase
MYLQNSKPSYEGSVSLNGPAAEVEVWYDEFGVPHIYAQNEADAYFALGYVHAQDRLFQMEMLRRAAGGRLSEVLGPELVKVDKLFRTLGINQFAENHAARFLSSDTSAYQRAALAYQKGINEFVRTGPTPLEFTIMGIPKTEFVEKDIYLAMGFMAFGFAEGLRVDPVLQLIKTQWGDSYLKDLAVHTPPDAERIPSVKGQRKSSQLVAALSESLNDLPVPLWQGSNGWAIAGDRTASGFPILANDTHMGFAQPAVWYEAHLEYPGFSFYGHHVAGIPFALLGNNRKVAWGLTMFENDDTDFFIEKVDADNKQVMFKNEWQPLLVRDEIIKVKGESDVILKVRTTPHGPLINGIIEHTPTDESPVALWWLLHHEVNHGLEAAYRLNHAAQLQDAEKAASFFSAPGLNVMYADVDGNIAWWAVAKLPIRPTHVESKFFLDGASGADEYLGYYNFSQNPHAINPPWGFVYSANNQPDTVDGVLHPGYYYPKSRAQRIKELLSADKKWTKEDVKQVNLDVVSRAHVEVAKEMAAVLTQLDNSDYEPLITALRNWDGDHQRKDTAPSIYYNLLSQLMKGALADELGTPVLESILKTSLPKNSYGMLLANDSSLWWDNVTTKEKRESRLDIFNQAARNSLQLLEKIAGNNPSEWHWEKFHTLRHKHPLSVVGVLDKIFSVGTFPVPGGSEVINNLHFDLDTTGYFSVTGGPALRKITDFGHVEEGETVSPTGQSGVLTSAHYDDQAEMYATGKFRTMWMNKEAIQKRSTLLRIQPQH